MTKKSLKQQLELFKIEKELNKRNGKIASEIRKDIKTLHSKAVNKWYGQYRPREYERKYRLFSSAELGDARATAVSATASVHVAPELIQGEPYTNWKGREISRSIPFGLAEYHGKHGSRVATNSIRELTDEEVKKYTNEKLYKKHFDKYY